MAIIGTFTRTEEKFSGELKTLSLKTRVSIIPVRLDGETTPDYRIMAGTAEIGAGWQRTSAKGRPYISIKVTEKPRCGTAPAAA